MISIKGATRTTLYDNPLDTFKYGSVGSLSAQQISELKREVNLLKAEQQDALEVLNALSQKIDFINQRKKQVL